MQTGKLNGQSTDAMNRQTPNAGPRLQIHRNRDDGMSVVAVERPGFCEFDLTLIPTKAEPIDALVGRLAMFLKDNRAEVVRQLVFGPVAAHGGMMRAMANALGRVDWPVTWTEGGSCGGAQIAGVQVRAVAGVPVETLAVDGQIVGRVFDDGDATHCLLGDIGPVSPAGGPQEQAQETFARLEAALKPAGMTMGHVIRTWFFLDDILAWYDQFNQVRNGFFARNGLQPGLFPASTAVGGKNQLGRAIIGAAWAIKPHNPAVRVQAVPSPGQCPATSYGSAFSRAIEILSPTRQQVLISGTASIAPDGRTAHPADARQQIELTMDVVDGILRSRGLSFADVTRAVAYFKSAADFPLFAKWCAVNDRAELPVVATCCDICRDQLLFELELDAVSLQPSPQGAAVAPNHSKPPVQNGLSGDF